jgi:hypothetical protein
MLENNGNAAEGGAANTDTRNVNSVTAENARGDANAPSSQMANPLKQQNTNPFLNFGFSSIFCNAFATGNNGGGNHTNSSKKVQLTKIGIDALLPSPSLVV